VSNVVILVGVSGSGKSTLAKQIMETTQDEPTIICSTDKFIDEEAKERKISYQEMIAEMQDSNTFGIITGKFYDEIEDAVKKNYNIIIDRTNLSKGGRIALLKKLQEMHETHDKKMDSMAVALDIPREEVDERLTTRIEEGGKAMSSSVIDNQFNNLQFPVKEEGFSEVRIYAFNGKGGEIT
jgi:adenylate kinase family enzyme